MKFFYDTEFIESPGRIDLISIGMVSDAGREYYAVSSEYDASQACAWVQQNVLQSLDIPPQGRKPREQIADDLILFMYGTEPPEIELWADYAAYDHVVLCWLFGAMVDLPTWMPMYTNDLQQLHAECGRPVLPTRPAGTCRPHHALDDARQLAHQYHFLRHYQQAILQ